MDTLTDLDAGEWRVVTGSGSVHLFSIRPGGVSEVARLPRQEEQASERDLIADLRRDGETLVLEGISCLEVGQDAAFWLRVRKDGVLTLRRTTTVISIEKLEEETEDES